MVGGGDWLPFQFWPIHWGFHLCASATEMQNMMSWCFPITFTSHYLIIAVFLLLLPSPLPWVADPPLPPLPPLPPHNGMPTSKPILQCLAINEAVSWCRGWTFKMEKQYSCFSFFLLTDWSIENKWFLRYTHALSPSYLMILITQSKVFLYLCASRPFRNKRNMI